VGSTRRLPSPFGLAGNGLIAIANPDSIVTAEQDGSGPRLLVAADGVESLVWSPDGTRLAFRTLGPESGQPTVVVINPDGTGLTDVARDVAPSERYDEPIAWSPDSTRIAVPTWTPVETGVAILAADGSGSTLILGDTGASRLVRTNLAWSPDGQWISFVGRSRNTSEAGLYIVHPDGTAQRRVADVNAANGIGVPSWAPDPTLSRLLFVDEARRISLVDLATGIETRVSTEIAIWPSWSPDHRSIAWWSDGVVVADAEGIVRGSQARVLMPGPASCTDPRPPDRTLPCGAPGWSPDGRWLFAPSGPGTTVVAISVDSPAEAIVIPLKAGTALGANGSTAWQRVAP
jgi:Tol biopolymer transport system component